MSKHRIWFKGDWAIDLEKILFVRRMDVEVESPNEDFGDDSHYYTISFETLGDLIEISDADGLDLIDAWKAHNGL